MGDWLGCHRGPQWVLGRPRVLCQHWWEEAEGPSFGSHWLFSTGSLPPPYHQREVAVPIVENSDCGQKS